jgi:PX domain
MEIRIPSYSEVTLDSKKYVVYHIEVSYRDWTATINKRYSDFYELDEVMKLIQKIIKQPLPQLPSQMILKYFLNKMTPEDIEKRRKDLEIYLQNLEATPCAKHSKFFPEFVGLPLRYREMWAIRHEIESNQKYD